jgi:hypothetical protein
MSEPPGLRALPRALSRPGVRRQALAGRAVAACSLCANSASGRTEVEVDSEMEGRDIGSGEWRVGSGEWGVGVGEWVGWLLLGGWQLSSGRAASLARPVLATAAAWIAWLGRLAVRARCSSRPHSSRPHSSRVLFRAALEQRAALHVLARKPECACTGLRVPARWSKPQRQPRTRPARACEGSVCLPRCARPPRWRSCRQPASVDKHGSTR